ncbi:hypothetical protein GBA52_022801 [Prunus armeniaca]|nr:hypothetical protein GBA52_022801 [Prunus armeniaca]
MAIGGLISNRNLGSFIDSGKVCQTNHTVVHRKGERLYNQGKTFYQNLCTPRVSASRNSYSPYLRAISSSDASILKPTGRVHDEGDLYLIMSLQSGIRSQSIITKQRSTGRCKSYLSSNHSFRSCIQSRKLDKLDNRQYQKYELVKVNRTRAYYKSEDNDITKPEVDSLSSIEGSSEAVLADGNVLKLSSWWEQFPKRWVIGTPLFTAFLLCNMDRILGGIWADKIGGKRVLGFGVIWWSVATVLTPVASKNQPSFLLIMRAFMGIGEAYSSPKEDPELSTEEKELIMGGNISKEPVTVIPWKLILSKPPVWALIICHFCHNWGTFILLTWMPTYYNQVLKFNLTESGLFCVLPWLTMAVFTNIGGWIADTLVSRGLSVTTDRPFFLSQLSRVKTPAMAVLCMACSQGSDAFSQSGLYSNHQDIGPRYSGVLLGLSNTAGVLAGVFGTAATRYILQRGSWDDVFKVAVALYLVGTLIWNLFSTGEKILD